MAPAVATVSGFIIPDGDSFPTTTHSPVAPPINVASDFASNPSTTTSHTVAPTASQSPITGPKSLLPAALIAGIVLAVLAIIGVTFFFVRRHFINKRAAKVTPARTRASQVAISGPIDFQHVSSADGNPPLWNNEDKVSMNFPKHEGPKGTSESPNKQKYTVNFGKMESGLQDHVQAMQFSRQDSF